MVRFVRDQFGDIYRVGAPRRRSHIGSNGVRVSRYEHGEEPDVLVSFLESEPGLAEEARLVLEQFRRGRNSTWEMGANAHELRISKHAATVHHDYWNTYVQLGLDEFEEALEEWDNFSRDRRELVGALSLLVFDSAASMDEAEILLQQAGFAVGHPDGSGPNELYAERSFELTDDVETHISESLARAAQRTMVWRIAEQWRWPRW